MAMPSLNVGGNQQQGQQQAGGVAPVPPGQSDPQYVPRSGPDFPQVGSGSGSGSASPGGGNSASGDDDALPVRRQGKPSLLGPPPIPVAPKRQPSSRPRSLRPGIIQSTRDWWIYVECRENSVVVYPARVEIPLHSLSRDPNNPLMQLVQRMINQKAASVRPGDLPYRPHVRFLVRPEYEGTYYQSFPALDTLTAPKDRQALEPDDDIQDIIAAG